MEQRLEEHQPIVALVLDFLQSSGYTEAYLSLAAASGISLEQVDVAVSLPEVIQEYKELCKERYGVEPELVRDSQSTARSLSSSSLKQHRLRPESIAGTTRLKPGNTPVTQAEYIGVVCENPDVDPVKLFCIELPLSCARRFKPSQLKLNSVQEHLLYGLVGCSDVGWRLGSVSQASRAVLEDKYEISKKMLQLFFKNRCQQRTRRKRKKTTEDVGDADPDGLVPLSPSNDFSQLQSLLEMVKGEDPSK